MVKQILVPVSRNERVKEMIPYVERVVHPGMKVVFLMRFRVDGFDGYLRAGRATGETGIPNPETVRRIGQRYSFESQMRLAWQRVIPACHTLQKKGADVAVEVYSGSLKETIKGYTSRSDVHLILQRSGIGHHILSALRSLFSVLRLSRRPSFSPTLSLVANCWPQ